MNAHKNWGIATLIFMIITGVSAFCKPLRKCHAVFGVLTLFCLIGAVASGSGLVKKGSKESETESAAE